MKIKIEFPPEYKKYADGVFIYKYVYPNFSLSIVMEEKKVWRIFT